MFFVVVLVPSCDALGLLICCFGFGLLAIPHTWSYDFAETCVFGKQSPDLVVHMRANEHRLQQQGVGYFL